MRGVHMRARQVKIVGASGQISLGKEYAGQPVVIEEVEKGVWLIKRATVIPDSELWLHQEPAKSRIDRAIAWAEKNEATEVDVEDLDARIR
jgi:hypothetical protein